MFIGADGDGDQARAIRAIEEVIRWADAEPDEDDWEGFYLSLDLLDEVVVDGDGAG